MNIKGNILTAFSSGLVLAIFLSGCSEPQKSTDTQRISRALEVYLGTGKSLSVWQQEHTPKKGKQ